MDRLNAMRLFVRAAELGNFSAVAGQFDIARSAVTRQIAALEAHLGVKLMARSTRRLSLTTAGAAYLERCRVILNLVDAAETDLSSENQAPRGTIRLSVPLSFGLKRVAPLLVDFARQYPEVSLDMDYSDRRVKLIDEGIDLSLRITGRLADTDVARRIGSVRLHAVASPEYLARHGRPRHPAELPHHECLGYVTGDLAQPWRFMVDGQWRDFPVHGRLQANNGDMLVEAAACGMGIALQPDFIVEEALAAGRIETILGDFPLPDLGIYALLPGNRHVPYRVRVLMEFLATGIGRRMGPENGGKTLTGSAAVARRKARTTGPGRKSG